jgi:chemotaxis regulatin CheY-phosphate phosphatase CheZ
MAQEENVNDKTWFTDNVRAELERLTNSINIMMENVKRMERPIMESQQKLPKANEQLDKISAQTEAAAHQMLDMVEQIIDHEEKVVELSGEMVGQLEKSQDSEAASLLEKAARIKEMAATSQNNAFLIMDALQFQDITAQQMSHASSLLEDIEQRLHNLLVAFDGDAGTGELVEPTKKARAFDPDADLFDGKDQKEVDKIISQITTKG